jgi:hypothetical protein
MLTTFKSKAASDVIMYGGHARRILELLHKDSARGVITSAEAQAAIDAIEHEVAESRIHPASEEVQRDVHAHHGLDSDDQEHEGAETVSFATRAFPLLEMLRAAKSGGYDVLWGV